jgi:hypothetical protein
VDLQDASLLEVLRAIAGQAGFRLTVEPGPDTSVSATLTGVSLDEGLRRLAREYSMVLVYAPTGGDGADPPVAEVRLYRRDQAPGGLPAAGSLRAPAAADAGAAELEGTLAQHPNSLLRASAAAALGRAGGEGAKAALAAALDDEAPGVRKAAIGALGQLGGARGVSALSDVLLRDPDPLLRRQAARALATLQTGEARAALLKAGYNVLLGDPDPLVRREAARALAALPAEVARPALLKARYDADARVRAVAAAALGR